MDLPFKSEFKIKSETNFSLDSRVSHERAKNYFVDFVPFLDFTFCFLFDWVGAESVSKQTKAENAIFVFHEQTERNFSVKNGG